MGQGDLGGKGGALIRLGANIPSNVVISKSLLIGAGSVATSNVPANAIVAGNSGE